MESTDYHIEPISRFVFLVENEGELAFECTTSRFCISGFNEDVKLDDDSVVSEQLVALDCAKTPGYPLLIFR